MMVNLTLRDSCVTYFVSALPSLMTMILPLCSLEVDTFSYEWMFSRFALTSDSHVVMVELVSANIESPSSLLSGWLLILL